MENKKSEREGREKEEKRMGREDRVKMEYVGKSNLDEERE